MKRGIFAFVVGAILVLTACGPGRTGTGTSSTSNSTVMAYVLNQGSQNISIFNLDTNSGNLTASGFTSPATGATPYAIAVTPNKQFAYVVNYGDSTISSYRIASNGGLSAIGTAISTGSAPISIAIDPTGNYVYTANTGSNNISGFSINNSTGALSTISSSPFSLANQTPLNIKSSPSNNIMYVSVTGGNASDNNILSFSVQSTSGALVQVGSAASSGIQPSSLAIDSSGKAGISTNLTAGSLSTFLIQSNGQMVSSGSSNLNTAGNSPIWVALNSNANFAYVADQNNNSISAYTFNTSTAAIAALGGSTPTGSSPSCVTIDPTNKYVYVTNNNASTVSAYAMDSTGALTALSGSPFTVGTSPIAMTFVSF
jgi:6-phosphogluconolactonase (cycloisomerase 2 family)